jgi:hypothetical protein
VIKLRRELEIGSDASSRGVLWGIWAASEQRLVIAFLAPVREGANATHVPRSTFLEAHVHHIHVFICLWVLGSTHD